MAFAQHDGGGDFLAQLGMGHGEGNHLHDGGMVQQHAIDFERADLLAAAVDDFLQAAGQAQIALAVECALIAGAEPAPPLGSKKFFALASGLLS